MKIDTLRAYSNAIPPQNGAAGTGNGAAAPARQNTTRFAGKENLNGNIVTQNERDFFVKMFPQNSEQIQNHVVFNRNGRLQSTNTSKGLIVDGRV